MTEKVRYGLLSTAQIGLNAHYPASIESEISEIVSVSSRSSKRAKEVANRNNIEFGMVLMKNSWLIQMWMQL